MNALYSSEHTYEALEKRDQAEVRYGLYEDVLYLKQLLKQSQVKLECAEKEIEKINDFKSKWNIETLNQIEQAIKDKQELKDTLVEIIKFLPYYFNDPSNSFTEEHLNRYKAIIHKM